MSLLLVLACNGSDGSSGDDTAVDPACAEQPNVTWENWAQGFFITYCTACHSETSPDRYGAPEGLDFDTEDQVATLAGLVRQTVLEDGSMPYGGGVYEEDLELLEIYLDCGL